MTTKKTYENKFFILNSIEYYKLSKGYYMIY